jgi:hypothetical protein
VGGYQTSDEMAGIAAKVNAEAGPIGDEADAITRSQVSTADGGRDFGDKAAAYAAALRHNVIASVHSYATATAALSTRLVDTYHRYAGADADGAGTITRAGHR